MLTTIGLTSKNAILIVEFARDLVRSGMDTIDAAARAAQERLRPIVMTSLAFGIGVLPLALATGAGSGAQNVVGRIVVGGMLGGTLLVMLYTPVFFLILNRDAKKLRNQHIDEEETQEAPTKAESPQSPQA